MPQTHKLITEKLQEYPEDVRALAIRALELSETNPETFVVEQLKGAVKQIVKEKDEN